MKEASLVIASINDLPKAAGNLLKFIGNQRVLVFYGKMGAGKTTFIKAICEVLGVQQHVSSPTFSLVNEYEAANGVPIYHFDFYRIKTEEEAMDIGCEEYFYSGHLCLIEWPEKILNLLPEETVNVTIETLPDEHRKMTFKFNNS